jgi:hypothetical protein
MKFRTVSQTSSEMLSHTASLAALVTESQTECLTNAPPSLNGQFIFAFTMATGEPHQTMRGCFGFRAMGWSVGRAYVNPFVTVAGHRPKLVLRERSNFSRGHSDVAELLQARIRVDARFYNHRLVDK